MKLTSSFLVTGEESEDWESFHNCSGIFTISTDVKRTEERRMYWTLQAPSSSQKNVFIYHCYQGEVNPTVALQEDEKNCALGCFYKFYIQDTAKLLYKLPQHQHTDMSTGETPKIVRMRTAAISNVVFINYWSNSVMKFGQHLAPCPAKIICYQQNGPGKNSFTLLKIFHGIYNLH